MDYDDNDFQSHNPQLAGESSTKFSPVLRPYALPKFDFDDSLQGHLRFDNLVETEVFLGIESQEDNQWIEDFSRASSGIEFSSSAAESCSISRRNNVWSEATSSESVEMLLKSVGQEEMIPGQTIIEESDACNELGGSTNQMEPILKQDDKVLTKVGDVKDSAPSLRPDGFLESFSGLKEDASGGLPQVEDTFQAHEGESSAYGSSNDLDPNAVGEKRGLTVIDGNLLIDSECNDVANQREVDTSFDEALDNRTLEDSSASRMQVDNLVMSVQIISTSIGQLNTQEAVHEVNDTSDENADGLQKDNGEGGEGNSVQSKEVQMDDQNMEQHSVESGTYNLENPLNLASKIKSVGERNAVETSISNTEEPSSMIVKGDSDLRKAEGCSEDACAIVPVQASKCEVVILSKDTEINNRFKENMHEESHVALGGDNNVEGHAIELSNTTSGICASLELKKDSLSQMTYGRDSFVDKKGELLESGNQTDSVISVSNSQASSLAMEGNNPFEGQCDGSSNSHVGDISTLKEVFSSAELGRETHATENLQGAPDGVGVSRADSKGEDHVPSSIQAESTICEENVVSRQGDVSNSDRDVSVIEKENVKLPTNSSDMDFEMVGSLIIDKNVESSSVGEGSTENEVIVRKSQSGTTAGIEPASGVVLEDANLASNDTLDHVPLSSGSGVTTDEVSDHKDGRKLPSLVVDFTHLDNKDETATGISTEASQSESQEVTPDKVNQEYSRELEVCPVICGSTVKEDGGAEVVALENHQEDTIKENYEEASIKVAGDASNSCEGSFSPVCMSECDAKSRMLEGGIGNADSEKPNCGSPTVISCIELSKSEKENHEEVRGSLDQNVSLSAINDGTTNIVRSISQDPKEKEDASKDEKSFSFEVSPLAELSEIGTGKGWQPFITIQASKVSPIVEGSPSISGSSQMDAKIAQEITRGSSRASDGEIGLGSSRGTPERKTRRPSSKATGKESAKKGNHLKETTVRQSERVEKSGIVSPSLSGTCQLVRSEEKQHSGHVERSSKKLSKVFSTPTSSLPDLNTSASLPAVFQQPFTDLQQVQLRAQIFVYGSLIQGTVPDEACMVSSFGGSDGGRSTWENAWRTSVERLHSKKSHPSNPETPLQPRSGARGPDQANKLGALQSKVTSSPVGRASSKSTPSPVVNPIIPLSSPLWSIPTPCDGLQSGGMPRGVVMDHNQALSPLHPYQTPPIRNFVGHNTSWLSQAPFPGPWVASAQTSAFDASARFSSLPNTETVKLTPVRETSSPHASGIKHVSPSPIVHSGGPTSVFTGTSSSLDMKKATVSPSQHSADLKPRKRKKVPVSEDLGQIPLPSQTQMEPVTAPGAASHLPTSVAVPTATCFVSKTNTGKFVTAAFPTSSTDHLKIGDKDVEQRVILSEETLNNVKEAKLQAEDAAALAAAAVNHSQGIWSQLDKQMNSGLTPDVEAKLASAAVAIAAASSVAKAAAAAAKLASDAALQAKLMAEEVLISRGNVNPSQINVISLSDGVNILGKATPASILKGENGANNSSSIIVAAREAARRRVEAASAASKRAENLDAIVKAAELAAEAVTQAGKIVAMGDPLPLSELVVAGLDGYWKVPQVSSEHAMKSNNMNREQSNIDSIEEGLDSSAKHFKVGTSDEKETQTTSRGKSPTLRELSKESAENHMRLVEGISGSITNEERDSRGQKGRKVSDLAKTIGVVPESEIGSRSASIAAQNEYEKTVETLKENSIKEGSLVEVFKDGDGFKAAWYSANVLSLKNGEAYVSYIEIPSEEGSGQLKEWVALEGEGDNAPRIRIAHPMTTIQFEGTRKRRRAAMGTYAWSVGDSVDAWIRDCWRGGVITEKNKKDDTTLTVHFPAQGETSIVRAWHLRPSLIWKDGEWIEWSSSRENDHSSHEGDTPQEKRLKLGSPAVEAKGKDKMSKTIDVVESGKPEESGLIALSANEKIFNVGRNTRDENKPDALRTMRTGLQKEGSRVIFGVPKPGKKRKFMEVSKHYVADRSSKANETNDSVKVAKYLMPQGSVSRGWKNSSKIDSREKRAAESKPRVLKSGKPQSVSSRTIPQKGNIFTSAASAPHDSVVADHRANIKDFVSHDENPSGKQSLTEFGSFSTTEGAPDGPILFSSLALPSDDPPSKKVSTSNSKSERANKGKLAPSSGKLAKIEEDKVYNGNSGKSIPEAVEPRRSNRRIQPTSRLLEGLQSSLIISKIPAVSHDKGHKSQNRSASSSRGNNHG